MENSNENYSEIDEIVKELKDSAAESSSNFIDNEINIPKIDDSNVDTYVYDKTAEIIENAVAAMKSMSRLIQTAATPEEIVAYTKLMQTAIKGIENLNKINIQQKQAKNNIEMKKIEAEGKKNQPLLSGGNNIFIGTREDALKLSPKTIKGEIIDSEIVDI
jgi:hypothetical protein